VLVRRLRPLAAKQAVSQQDLDDALARQAEARAAMDSAQANLDQAELDLSYTKLTAPITGIAGTALVRTGNLVGKDEPTLLTTVSQVDPIRVRFAITERDYLGIAMRRPVHERAGEGGGAGGTGGAPPPQQQQQGAGGTGGEQQRQQQQPPSAQGPAQAQNVQLRLQLPDGSVYPAQGRLLFAGREIDPSTGTLQVQGIFPNGRGLLRPGQSARVLLTAGGIPGALVVPQQAVNDLQGNKQIAVLDAQNVARIVPVQVGPDAGRTNVVVQGDIKAGDRVVVEGFDRGAAHPRSPAAAWSPAAPRRSPVAAPRHRSSLPRRRAGADR
jgi:membrane fusion protein (multidrug efflux system)